MRFQFTTTTTIKEQDRGKWWINSDLIDTITLHADTLEQALKRYKLTVNDIGIVTISDNAMRNKEPMYVDDKDGNPHQVGYVLTGKTLFEGDSGYVDKYIDLWVQIHILTDPQF